MSETKSALLNTGIYGLAEAARLAKVSKGKIRRWMCGYDFGKRPSRHHSEALWQGAFEPIDGKMALGFLDLVEIRFVDAFIRAGVSWATMRKAHLLARKELRDEHPFCSNQFVTDGRRILLRQASGPADQALIDVLSNQREFKRIVEPFVRELEFAKDHLARWWPMGRERQVVVDPVRNLGQPTAARSGVPTQTLAQSYRANGSVDVVARWYEVLPEEVQDAVAFEKLLAA